MHIIKIRLFVFLGLAIVLAILEVFYSYRKREISRIIRWPSNIAIVAIDSAIVRVLLPLGLVGIAHWARVHNWGVFNFFHFSKFIALILTFIILDLAIYIQHVYSHKWHLLWIFHRVHHTDIDLDITTALRFHPIEIIYSLIYKIFIVLLIGANAKGLLLFEVVLNSMAMFNHANLYIPQKIEKYLRIIFVTPQMHIIHHSVEKNESDTNFGFNFSLWDFLFKTYTSHFSSSGVIGQSVFRTLKDHKLMNLLLQPFSR